jgi:transcriptional regulator NrdR family protein
MCPSCGHAPYYAFHTIRTRSVDIPDVGIAQLRRRKCHVCDTRWYTVEMPIEVVESEVLGGKNRIKRD